MTTAAWWFRHQVQGLLRRLKDPRWELVIAVSPDVEGLQSRVWPQGIRRIAQGSGNLGDRMARALASTPCGSVCVIGADIPAVRKTHIATAFAKLGQNEAVFGPAPDGGYWLVGLKNARPAPPTMFQDVRWSSEYALEDSVRSLKDFRIAYVDELRDVDTADDLRMTLRSTRATSES